MTPGERKLRKHLSVNRVLKSESGIPKCCSRLITTMKKEIREECAKVADNSQHTVCDKRFACEECRRSQYIAAAIRRG